MKDNVLNLQKGKKEIKLQIEKKYLSLEGNISCPFHLINTFHQDFQTVFYCFLISVTKHIL